jgi:hypothetical protein
MNDKDSKLIYEAYGSAYDHGMDLKTGGFFGDGTEEEVLEITSADGLVKVLADEFDIYIAEDEIDEFLRGWRDQGRIEQYDEDGIMNPQNLARAKQSADAARQDGDIEGEMTAEEVFEFLKRKLDKEPNKLKRVWRTIKHKYLKL